MRTIEELRQLVEVTFSREKERVTYLHYIDRLESQGLPPIFSYHHLADEIGLSYVGLAKMCFGTEHFYRSFSIPKRSGALRQIDAPLTSLAEVQKWINKNIIENLPIEEDVACAYRRGCSIKDHVSRHVSKSYLLKLDIEGFFPSISTQRVAILLASLGYSTSVASIIAHLLTLRGTLPQGAPSSPAVSNVIMRDTDVQLKDYCLKNDFAYSRYADDLAFSGDLITQNHIDEIGCVIEENGFKLNVEKTQLFSPKMKGRLLTGLVINDDTIRVPKSTRRKIRQTVYYLDRYYLSDIGLGGNLKTDELTKNFHNVDPIGLERVIGQLLFWRWVEPDSGYVELALRKLNDCQRQIAESSIG